GAACLYATHPSITHAEEQSLRDLAASKGVLFGSCITNEQIADPAFARLFASQCAIAVPENALKWAALRPTPELFDFKAADALYHFCSSHGLLFRGHALVWEQALPRWFGSTITPDNALTFMTNHIAKVTGHYAGKMHSWDVVNEAFQIEDRRPDGLKVTPWLQM